MYSIDINLLSERAEYQVSKQTGFANSTNIAPTKYGKTPLYIGVGVAALTLLATGGGWLWLGQQTTELEAKQKDLDVKLGALQAQDIRLQALNTEVTQVNTETQAFASIFDQVQPWSAVLQDLRESIPQGVQIASVSQSEVKPTAAPIPAAAARTPSSGGLVNKISTPPNPEAKPSPSPAPGASPVAGTPATPLPGTPTTPTTPTATLPADVPTSNIDITGTAKSFEEVNNFILTLKQSAFFNPDETQLLSAALGNSPILTKPVSDKKEPTEQEQAAIDKITRLELPKVVEYKIRTSLKRTPANDLIRELERKGAVGLVTRLRSLQQQAIKP